MYEKYSMNFYAKGFLVNLECTCLEDLASKLPVTLNNTQICKLIKKCKLMARVIHLIRIRIRIRMCLFSS